ncbi:MAG TPA: methyl-accepting chemotaxis protein [Cellvibrio sp.]|nr:methyl-accepting chemotaxis protein [Cellvibrio sp.]
MISFNSIQTRLTLAVGGGILLLILIASGAVLQLKNNIDAYQQLLNVSINNERQIQNLNFSFKVQVQEWKNVLLRGKDPAQNQKYWDEFQQLQREIQTQAKALLANLPKDESRELIEDFLYVHDAAFPKYQSGLKTFADSGFDPSTGDKAVTGIDREPSKMLSEAATFISKLVQTQNEEIKQSSASVMFWSQLLVILFGVIILLGVWITLKIALLTPLFSINKHLHTLAEGNFSQSLSLSQAGEIGELNNSITSVQASIIMILDTIKNSSKTLNSSSSNLNNSASSIASSTHEIYSSTDQMATALEEMSSTVQEVANNAANAADAANIADTSARKGTEVMGNTITSINQLSKEVDNVNIAMTRLEAETGRIGGVLDVIKNVAEQTNLLALNAAIEAARAGEQGRGFAVVADEVRSLAKRTQESTAEIQQIIEAVQNGAALAMQAMRTSQGKAQSTMEMAAQAGNSINDISNAVAKIQSMNTQIATAAEEQSYAAEEINRNVQRIVKMVDDTNTQAQKSTQIAESLDSSSRDLERQIMRFKV